MDCDEYEGSRLKSIAESKLEQKDYWGAKKYALAAQTLCPGLGGISQLLMTVDVYLCADKKISGEIDLYGVLGVNPSDDHATINQKYKKLALMLHPDKNSCVGADGGFKIISEAKMMLLDSDKRAAYDARMGYKGLEQKTPAPAPTPTPCRPHPKEVPAYNESQSVPPRSKNRNAKVPRTPNAKGTFWTACSECCFQHEYHKIFCSELIICVSCSKPFIAVEIAVSVKTAKPVPWSRRKHSYRNLASQKPGAGQSSPNSCNLKRSRASAGLEGEGESDFATEGAYGIGINGSSDEPKSTGEMPMVTAESNEERDRLNNYTQRT